MGLESIKGKIINDDNKPKILSGSKVLIEEAKEIEFILYPWLNNQGLALIFAERGVGKTHVALNSAYAIATAGEYLGWHANKARRVLYIDGEMQFPFLKQRFVAIANMFPVSNDLIDNFSLITPDKYGYSLPDLATKDGQAIIEEHLEETQSEILFIDNLSCLMPSLKSNDNDAWRLNAQQWILRLRKEGKAIVLVNHAGKFKKDIPIANRGASSQEDVLDSVLLLSKPIGYEESQGARFDIEFKKHRNFYGLDAVGFEAWLKEDEKNVLCWFKNNTPRSTYDSVCLLYLSGKKAAQIANDLKISTRHVYRLLEKGAEEGKIKEIDNIVCTY